MNQKPGLSYPTQFAALLGLLGGFIIITAFAFAILGSVILDVPLSQVADAINKPENADTARLLNTVSSLFAFFAPAMVLARIISTRPFKQLGFNTAINMKQVLLILVITFAAMVLSGALGELNEKIPLPAKLYAEARQLEDKYRAAMMAMATMHSFGEYLLALLVIAAFPALFEEVLFRGGFQQVLVGWTKSKWAGIIITSILFSAIHFSYFGFLARVGLGIVLGLVFYNSRNLWLSILLHFLNNAFVVTQLYILSSQGKPIDKTLDESMPVWWGAVALVVIVILFQAFNKQTEKVLAEKKDPVLSSENIIS